MQIRKLRKWNMYGIIYTVHVPLCSIHFLISLIDKRSSFPMLYNPTFLYTFVFSISWLLKPAMYAYKYRLAFLSETNRWLSINYQTKKVCLIRHTLKVRESVHYTAGARYGFTWLPDAGFNTSTVYFHFLPSAVS